MLDDTEPTVLEHDDHEWPDKLPAHQRRVSRTAYTRVRPDLVVEVSADLALDWLRWRHPVPASSPCAHQVVFGAGLDNSRATNVTVAESRSCSGGGGEDCPGLRS